MMTIDATIAERIVRLERTVRNTRLCAGAAAIALAATFLTAATRQQGPGTQDTVRTRVLVIEDSTGRDRIVLGAPLPDGRQYVGMQILSPDGAEQFGLGLKVDGAVSMGFDARPGVGDQRNRERLNMGVTATGRGWIRYLDNQTRARMWVTLDSAGAPWVQFLDWPDERRILVRQVGFAGEQSLEWKP